MKKRMFSLALAVLVLMAGFSTAAAGENGTKEEAVGLAKKAIELIKASGNEKAFAEICDPKGQFIDRDLYVVVYDMNGVVLAHGANAKMIGKEMIDYKDVDGKEYVKERIAMMKSQQSGWQEYKFMNPVSKQIEPKTMYIERLGDLIVGCGVYVK